MLAYDIGIMTNDQKAGEWDVWTACGKLNISYYQYITTQDTWQP